MKTRVAVWVVVGLAMCLASPAVLAAAGIGGTTRSNRGGNREPSRYYVLLIMDADGSPVTEVVADTKYKDRREEIEKEFVEAAKDWKRAQVEAKRAGEEFSEKPPRGPRLIKRLDKSFKEKEDADEYAEKYQEFIDKKLAEKRGDKPEEGFLDDPDDKKDKGDDKKDDADKKKDDKKK